MSIHLHLAWTVWGKPWVICLEAHVGCAGGRREFGLAVGEGNVSRLELSLDEQRESVLVLVYQEVELGERFIPSLIRLNRFDLAQNRCRNAVQYPVVVRPIGETVGVGE